MSFVATQPESLAAGAGDLLTVGSAMAAHHAAAATPTRGILPAAPDEVSAPAASQFAMHAEKYQVASARAAAVRNLFRATLAISASSYPATKAAHSIAAG